MSYNVNTISDFYKKEAIRNINSYFKVSDCLTNNRKRPNVEARAALAYFLNKKKELTLQYTGNIIGKDHATVMYLVRLHIDICRYNRNYQNKYIDFENSMKAVKTKRWLCVETPFNLQIIKK
jgi:chromosomal replication initiation ATPase DnaA